MVEDMDFGVVDVDMELVLHSDDHDDELDFCDTPSLQELVQEDSQVSIAFSQFLLPLTPSYGCGRAYALLLTSQMSTCSTKGKQRLFNRVYELLILMVRSRFPRTAQCE
jgi:hypothetical protein